MFLSLNLCGALLRVKVVVVVVTYGRSEIPAALLRNGLILRLMDILCVQEHYYYYYPQSHVRYC